MTKMSFAKIMSKAIYNEGTIIREDWLWGMRGFSDALTEKGLGGILRNRNRDCGVQAIKVSIKVLAV